MQSQPADILSFSRFTICLSNREFLVDGTPVELGGRNYDVLIALIEAGGAVVSKSELMNRVWPQRIVEDGNLHACISRLRKLMGPDRKLIRTVSGRGYRFTGDVQHVAAEAVTPCDTTAPGRDELLARLGQLMLQGGSLCGAAGSERAARQAMLHGAEGIWILSLALIPTAIANTLGLVPARNAAPTIASLLDANPAFAVDK
jgi:DNA-binding winged helix-turn-helix (wHTH) protein